MAGPLAEMNVTGLVFISIANLFLFFQDTLMFLGLNTVTGELFFTPDFEMTNPKLYELLLVPQAWTIGLELLFYLIAPLILRRNLVVIMVLITFSLMLRLLLYNKGFHHDPWTYRFFPNELAFFLFGNVSYQMYIKIDKWKTRQWALNLSVFFILLFTILFDLLVFPKKELAYFVSLIMILPFVFKSSRNYRLDTYIGELSYPVYMSQMLILGILIFVKVQDLAFLGITLSALTILFSIVINELVSKRIERVRQKRIKVIVASNE